MKHAKEKRYGNAAIMIVVFGQNGEIFSGLNRDCQLGLGSHLLMTECQSM